MIGVSGDGDSLSIGLGQLCHAIRRNVNMLYMLENNGVYGLTKGQFSAGADAGRHLRGAQLLGRQGAAGADEISADYEAGSAKNVLMHDGSWVKFRKLAKDYDPTNRDAAYAHIREHQKKGEVVTGLLYISPDSKDVHDQNETVPGALYNLLRAQLCPGNDALQKLMGQFR